MGAKKLFSAAILLILLACSGDNFPGEYILVDGTFGTGTHRIELSLRTSHGVPYPEGFYIITMHANDYEYVKDVLITDWHHPSPLDYDAPIRLLIFKYGGPEEIAFDLPEDSYVTIKLIRIATNHNGITWQGGF